MEGNESFATAATRAVTEELRGLIHIDGGGFRLKAGAVPSLERCCGPRTYIWEGELHPTVHHPDEHHPSRPTVTRLSSPAKAYIDLRAGGGG